MRLRLVAASLGVAATLAIGTAFASAAAQDYPGGTTEQRVDATEADQPQVLGETLNRATAEVEPTSATAAVGAEAILPVTGSDLAGLAVIGVGLVALGTVAVRRARTQATPPA